MSVAAAVWCVHCGAPPELTITFERRGALAHYGACRAHVAVVAGRAVADLDRVDAADRAARTRPEIERA